MKTTSRLFFLISFFMATAVHAQDVGQLVENVKSKLAKVHEYEARGKMKTNVSFLKVPVADITVFFRKPDQIKIKSDKGVSFIPKGAVSINTGSLLKGNDYTVIDGGNEKINGQLLRVARLLPNDDNSDVVLSTIYIDPVNMVIKKARTTTRENGTYELEMSYGKYSSYGLPDKLIFSFNTKDYKLPKGVTFDFDDGTNTAPQPRSGPKKGRAEISFSSYKINQGISETGF
jgi:outer membrane lipoprotein-sorting protein